MEVGYTSNFENENILNNLMESYSDLKNQVVNEIQEISADEGVNKYKIANLNQDYINEIRNILDGIDLFKPLPTYLDITGSYWVYRKIMLSEPHAYRPDLMSTVNACLIDLTLSYIQMKGKKEKLDREFDELVAKPFPQRVVIDLTDEGEKEKPTTDLFELKPVWPEDLTKLDYSAFFPAYAYEDLTQEDFPKKENPVKEVDEEFPSEFPSWSSVIDKSDVKMVNKVFSPDPALEKEFKADMKKKFKKEKNFKSDSITDAFLENELKYPNGHISDKIKILPSELSIEGQNKQYGVFTNKEIKKDEILGFYASEILLITDDINNMDKDYFFSLSEGYDDKYILDARRYGNWTRFLNHADSRSANVGFYYYFFKGVPYIIFHAKRKIAANKELFFNYGPEYWKEKKIQPVKVADVKKRKAREIAVEKETRETGVEKAKSKTKKSKTSHEINVSGEKSSLQPIRRSTRIKKPKIQALPGEK